MSSSKQSLPSRRGFLASTASLAAGLLILAGCTVQPLAGSGGASVAGQDGALRFVDVEGVRTREAQQLRNALLFAIHGGERPTATRYSVQLTVQSNNSALAFARDQLAPTASQITLNTSYILKDATSGERIGSGAQTTVAAYDSTSQRFADTRAQRDAENRAAREAAQKIRFALARDLVGR